MLATAPDTELDYDPRERRPVLRLVKHSGRRARDRWEWVEDPTATETGPERHARLLADERLIDMWGLAGMTLRSYATIKDMRHEADAQRTIAAAARRALNPRLAAEYEAIEAAMKTIPAHAPDWDEAEQALAGIDEQIIKDAQSRIGDDVEHDQDAAAVEQALFRLNGALKLLLTAIPRERDEQGQTPLWSVGDVARWRRRRRMNNIWGDKEENRGRPKGSKTATTEPEHHHAAAS